MYWQTNDYVGFDNALLGKVLTNVTVADDVIRFHTDRGEEYQLFHEQDCCEHVYVESVVGNIEDILNSPILQAEEVTEHGTDSYDSFTWTFYKLATIKGDITIRWYGTSNGYYSESVSFVSVTESVIH